jgi:L-threonylcarbamoyladenylate synthase
VSGTILNFDDAVGLLQAGGVLLLGTDTLPGFHCRADRDDAIARIQEIKGREAGKSLLVLAGSSEQADLVTGSLAERQTSYCRQCWPGPFSLILPSGKGLSPLVNAGRDTVAVRVPAPESLRDLILSVGFPLVSTSVNLAGDPPSATLDEALQSFGPVIDGVWQPTGGPASAGDSLAPGPSALVDVTVWPPRQLRRGPENLPDPVSGGLDGGSGGI